MVAFYAYGLYSYIHGHKKWSYPMNLTKKKFTKCTSLYADNKELAMLDELKNKRGFKSNASIFRQGLFLLYNKEFENVPSKMKGITRNYEVQEKMTS